MISLDFDLYAPRIANALYESHRNMHIIWHNRSTDLEKMGKTSLAADSNLSFPYLYFYCPLHILKHFATIMKYCVEWCSVIFERSPDAFLSYT